MNRLEQLALTRTRGVGVKTLHNLLMHCGSPAAVFRANARELSAIPNLGKQTIAAILAKEAWKPAEQELRFLEKQNIKILWTTDPEYPQRLRHCEDAPLLLYVKGKANLNPKHAVSIVGTRNATAYGLQLCADLICSLSSTKGVQIISGLAYGIDIQAHRLALQQGIPTLGILAHGFEHLYPAAHREIAQQMLDQGGLLTEFAYSSKPERISFPARNRIIAGLSDVTVVVEAASRGGALITAEIANSYNRDVCAFPGNINQVYSEGCNYLIKTHRAHLIRHADDLRYLMGWEQPQKKQDNKQLSLLKVGLTKEEAQIAKYLAQAQQANMDDIAQALAWPISKVAIQLLNMELNEHVIALPGRTYKNL